MDLSSRRVFLHLTFLFAGAALLRVALNYAIAGPYIFNDEYQYIGMARAFPDARGLVWNDKPTFFPCWLYPILTSPFFQFFSWDSGYGLARALNAALMAAAVFPAYGLARELGGHRRAMLAAGLTAALPAAGYAACVMPESLFLPVFLLAAWLIYRAVLRPTFMGRLLAGAACGLAFHVKPHGLMLPVIAALTVMLFEAGQVRFESARRTGKQRAMAYLGAVGRHWVMALGWALAMAPRVWIAMRVEQPDKPFSPGLVLGDYEGTAAGMQGYAAEALLLSVAVYAAAWACFAGVLPAWASLRTAWGGWSRREDAPARLMAILTLTAAAALLGLAARHTLVSPHGWKLHERYFFVSLPLALILFAMRPARLGGGVVARFVRGGVVIAMIALGAWGGIRLGLEIPNSAPSLTGALLLTQKGASWSLVTLWLAPAVLGLGLFIWRPGGIRRQAVIVALLLLTYSIGWYGVHARLISRWSDQALRTAQDVDRLAGAGEKLVTLSDQMPPALAWRIAVRNPGLLVHLSEAARTWYSQRLSIASNGEANSPFPAEGAWLLTSNRWRMTRKPNKAFADCAIYRLGGMTAPRFDPAQLAHYQADPTSPAIFSAAGLAGDIRCTVMDLTLPESVTPHEAFTLSFKLRNDNAFAWPGGSFGVGLGCRWLGAPEGGEGRVWMADEWVGPGEVVDVRLNVAAPAAGAARLELRPLVVTRSGRRQTKAWGARAVFEGQIRVAPAAP